MDRFTVNDIPHNEALRTPVVDTIVRHASVRKFDGSQPLPEGLVTVLVAAAQSAPSSFNVQAWSVIEVADPALKKALDDLLDQEGQINDAPLFFVFCADTYRLRQALGRRGWPLQYDHLDLLLVTTIDTALAAENCAVAAESLGLGTCFIGDLRLKRREIAEMLKLPKGVFATFGMTIGHAAKRNPVKPRLPQSAVLHRNRYSVETLERDLARYDEMMIRSDVYKGRRERVPGLTPEPEKDTVPYGWTEHTARRFASDHHSPPGTLEFLRDKGFQFE